MKDEKIIELFFARDEKAIEETDLKYKKYLLSVAYNIVHDRRDSEECLNDTYLGAWNAMPPSKPSVLKAFLTTIMRRISIKRYHSNLRKTIDTIQGFYFQKIHLEKDTELIVSNRQYDTETQFLWKDMTENII